MHSSYMHTRVIRLGDVKLADSRGNDLVHSAASKCKAHGVCCPEVTNDYVKKHLVRELR
jgi:hypothetical protein